MLKEVAQELTCVIYARYSSHSQRDCSIEQQVAECSEYAKRNNMRVVKVYADRHLSGTSDKRPEFQRMLRDAQHSGWDVVLCWKIDRFARNRYDSATYKYKLKKCGVKVMYAMESIPEGPEGILLESILEGSAEYYSANLAENVRRGMMYNAQQCKVNSGTIPLGYRKGADGRFELVEAEAEIVREIYNSFASGMTYMEIARSLNARGIRTKTGKEWGKNSFHTLLTNESYTGVYHYGGVRIEGGVPAIIDKELFEEVGKKMAARKISPARPGGRNADYMLTGKLKCGHCGSNMIGHCGTSKTGAVHYYYKCQGRHAKKCNKKTVRKDWIERRVVQLTVDYVLRPDVIEWIADAVIEYQERDADTAERALLGQRLADVSKRRDNVMKAIEAGIITESTQRRLQELESECKSIEASIHAEEASHTHFDRKMIVYWLNSFRGGSVDDLEFCRKIIDTFVNVIYLYDDHIRIAFNYSGDSKNEVDAALIADAETTGESLFKASHGQPASAFGLSGGFLFCLKIRL